MDDPKLPRPNLRALASATWTLVLQCLVAPAIEALLPAACPGCAGPLPGLSHYGFCAGCWDALTPVASPICPRCGLGLPVSAAGAAQDRPDDRHDDRLDDRLDGRHDDRLDDPPDRRLCGSCTSRPPAFDGARCAVIYEGPIRAMVQRFKFGHRTDLAKPLARRLLEALPPEEAPDLVVEVPLHWTRRLARGYNQAGLLARHVAKSRGLRHGRAILRKARRTADQAHLGASERRTNLSGAFALGRNARTARSLIAAKRILLIDDVLTTGATADACARVLKEGGAARVFVLALARTPVK